MNAIALALVVATQTAAPQPQAPQLEAPYEMFTLDNGLRVVLHKDPSATRVAVNTWYHVGSAREAPGRTGFAHLFEHLMFEGSAHVPEGAFDVWLESAGGNNNGSTTEDRTNYWEEIPRGALDLALFLESDRMGYLLPTMTEARVDGQRDIVKNERRQSYENRPYGVAWLQMPALLYPAGHPYSWTVIGSMEDLSAASFDDVTNFFRRFYGPNNATLVVAGDIDIRAARKKVEHWFSDIPRGKNVHRTIAPLVRLTEDKSVTLTDDVQLEKILITWPTVPVFHNDDAPLDLLASLLGAGKNARLQKRLVHELKKAQSVEVWHSSQALSGQLTIEVLAKPGGKARDLLPIVDDEIKKLLASGPTERELTRAKNQTETQFLDNFERIGGFGGRADRMNSYVYHGKKPDFFQQDLARYLTTTGADIQRVGAYLQQPRLIMDIVPEVKK